MSYPNVLEKFNEYLPLSGGTMSGTIKKNGFLAQNIVDDNLLVIRGGTDATSAFLGLCGKNHSNKGMAYLCAADGTNTTNFCVLPEGYATLAGSKVITSAGGTITGNLIVSSIQFSNKGLLQTSNDAQYKSITITSENTWSNEVPFIVMRKIDATNSDKGTVYINAGNGTTYSRITLNADSSLNHDGRPIVSVTKWTSGNNWYRKYADGWIEQGGSFSSSTNINSTTTKIT